MKCETNIKLKQYATNVDNVRIVLEKLENSFILLDTPTMKINALFQLEHIDSIHLTIDTGRLFCK